jgi:methionyl-tRNA formyltransferase
MKTFQETTDINRVIVFGGGEGAYYFISEAIKSGLDVIVVTTPFRLSGMIDEKRNFREALVQDNVTIIEIKDSLTKEILLPYVDEQTIGFSVVTFFIFKEEIINLFGGRIYNYHGALLPEEKGGGTFTHKILSQFYEGGLSIHKVTKEIDAGPIILQKKFQFPKNCKNTNDFVSFKEFYEQKLLKIFLSMLVSGQELKEYKQRDNDSFFFPLLNTKINGVVDWRWQCKEIDIFIKAFDDPYEGASTKYMGKVIHLKNSEVLRTTRTFHPFQSGIILRKDNEGVYIASIGGILKIKNIMDENKEDITKNIRLGERLYSPVRMIENALEEKVKYGPLGLKNE